jgi:predicted amidophosphoribosyltransferase
VDEIAKAMGEHFGIEIIHALIKNSGTSQIKDVGDPAEREKLLLETIQLKEGLDFSNKKLLLIDDLYQSGSTLSVATSVLKDKGKAHKVFVLTMTKTRR